MCVDLGTNQGIPFSFWFRVVGVILWGSHNVDSYASEDNLSGQLFRRCRSSFSFPEAL